ncbi:sensor histidine kinase [Promicromonospora sp. MS192]|uniref:sensor histidine kinase n=1 Tax=Promicromonospora sp. MS192 TaxID=3412684 RepID=UPI003C2FBC65
MGERRFAGAGSTVSTRRFEAYVRWSTYGVAVTPVVSLFSAGLPTGREAVSGHLGWFALAAALTCAVTAGNFLVTRWALDVLVERPRAVARGVVVAWLVGLAGLVVVSLTGPVPEMRLTSAAAVGSAAAAVVPVLDARPTLYLNGAIVLVAAPLAAAGSPLGVAVGVGLITLCLWSSWSSTWVLRVLRDLQRAHEDRAALALANERLRISRDLHDVFGRTLTTIAVKSEFAAELVRRGGGERAAEQIAAVRQLADEAGNEVRRVVRGETRVTWDGEVAGARSLLASAGIRCTVTGSPVPQEHAEALAWVVREGVTNVLRHSSATQVTLATTTEDGQVQLTLANDGAGQPGTDAAGRDGGGTGLRAMADRLRSVGGRVTTRRDGDWFLLDAQIPLSSPGAQRGLT